MAAVRPVCSIFQYEAPENKAGTAAMPTVFSSPLRPDLIRLVHTNMAKNKRQAISVKDESGYDTAAASWGTGRAVARIPRVPGGGTHRSGQGAFGNMCRGGGMFNPTKTWRRWHRKTNTTQKRHAVASAIAATGVPALVFARGHKIEEVPELPLVVSSGAEGLNKTKNAVALLKGLGLTAELDAVVSSKKLRAGKGKARNRRFTMKKGPLVVYDQDEGITRAFRNIPGVDLACVDRLNLLQLAPGGSIGRLVVYTEGAFKKLQSIFGSYKPGSSVVKKNYVLPRPIMVNSDISRIINSNEVQTVLEPAKELPRAFRQKKNPLKNASVLGRICPAALKLKKVRASAHVKGTKVQVHNAKLKAKKTEAAKKHKKASRTWYKELLEAHIPKVEEAADESEE